MRKARKERPAILAPARLDHPEPNPLRHLSAVAEVTRRSQAIALAALHEALTQPVSAARVEQLRRVTKDMEREVTRLEESILLAMAESPLRPGRSAENPLGVEVVVLDGGLTTVRRQEDAPTEHPATGERVLDAPIVRIEDPPVRTAEEQTALDGLARLARMGSAGGDAPVSPVSMPLLVGLRNRVNELAAELGEEYPCTGGDAAELGEKLAQAGDVQGLRDLVRLLVLERQDSRRYGPELDAHLYGPKPRTCDEKKLRRNMDCLT